MHPHRLLVLYYGVLFSGLWKNTLSFITEYKGRRWCNDTAAAAVRVSTCAQCTQRAELNDDDKRSFLNYRLFVQHLMYRWNDAAKYIYLDDSLDHLRLVVP